MYPYEPDEARAVFRLLRDGVERQSGLGDLIFRVETTLGQSVTGHVVERDGESSRDGVLLGAIPPDNSHHFVRWDEMVWIAVGFTE